MDNAAAIAGLEEIEIFWTECMRDSSGKVTERIKASELLAKVLGLFEGTGDIPTLRISFEDPAVQALAG